jgi:dTDP-glucose 4,6-dehydratase
MRLLPQSPERCGVNVPRRLLVTGGAGFVGTNFVRYWLHAHPSDRVVVLDALTYAGRQSNLENLPPERLQFVRGDICDFDLVLRTLQEATIDTIVHLAAETHVDRSIQAPDAFIRTNVIGTHSVLEAARAAWCSRGSWLAGVRFHHGSTDEVYGSIEAGRAPVREAAAYAPSSPYSASKAAADHLVLAYHRTYGLPATIIHSCNNYGPYQHADKLVPLTVTRALLGRKLPLYGTGLNMRHWLHVADHCRAIGSVLGRGRAGERYNIGSEAGMTNIELVTLLCRIVEERFRADPAVAERHPDCPAAAGHPLTDLIELVPDRAAHDFGYAMDCDKARRELAFAPMHVLRAGLEQTVDWYVTNRSWWNSAQD